MRGFRVFGLLALAVLFSTCSKLNEVVVRATNFEDEIQLAQNLVFTFNKDLVPEAELGIWQSTKFVEFEPAIPGRFKWVGKNELVFSPTSSFQPATEYQARLSDKILTQAKDKSLGVSSDKLTFHTPYLEVKETEAYWTRSRTGHQAVAKLKLHFNYPVSGGEVGTKLTVSEKDQKVGFSIGQNGVASTVPLTLSGVQEAKPLDLKLESGLPVANTTFKTKETTELQTTLPDPKTLEIVRVETGFENNRGFIKVITTQELNPENLAAAYQLISSTAPPATVEYDTLGNPIPVKTKTTSLQTQPELLENGLLIRGDFNETDTYTLTLNSQLRGVLGPSLSEAYTKDLYFGRMPAGLEFVHKKAVYLTSKGHRNVAVNITNIPKVQVRIAKIYENNILSYLRNNRYRDYRYDSEGNGSEQGYVYSEDGGTYSDIVVNKTIETEDLPKTGGVSLLNLSLPDPTNSFRGIYLVSLNSNDEYYHNATKLVSISDIGLIGKQSGDEFLVFAHSIRTTEPLKNVQVNLVSSNNQTLQTIATDSKGLAVFKDLKESDFTTALITARTDEDFNYLFLEDTQVQTSRFEVEGKRDNASGFEAFLYGDRTIYRPGETLHFNVVVRKQTWETPGEIPLKVRLLMPNGKEYRTLRLTTNTEGAVAQDIPLETATLTGTYQLEVLNANDVLLTSQAISVEEFMPDRIKVDVRTPKESYRSGETAPVTATATNLFGPPAADRNYEMELQVKRQLFRPKGYEGFVFDIPDQTKFDNQVRQGKTDATGLASERFVLPATWQDMGLLEAQTFVTVFDETGRPVNRLQRFTIQTQPVLYGIGLPDTYVGTNAPVTMPLVALNAAGQPVTATGQIDIVKHEYQTVIEKNTDGSMKYSSKRQSKVVFTREVTFAKGRASVSYAPATSGEYEIRLHRTGSRNWTSQEFYAYGRGQTSSTAFEVNNEGQVEMTFDKARYEVGDKAKVLFKTPFAGKLLVTVERNRVLEHHLLDTDEKSAELQFSIGEEHLPNVYVSATLFRPMDDADLPLTVAHGYAPVMVGQPNRQLPVTITAIEQSRSKTKQTIRVKTEGRAQVTLAVVDEGILQLKNYKSPDPYGFFYQKRALEVGGFDLYAYLHPELSIRSRSSVGGDGFSMEKRINPLANGRVKLVALWSGILTTNGSGEAEFSVDIPQFSGDLRIMAVAYKDKAFGSASKNMKVADPLVISTALPRFASPNDELTVPVSITNTTKKLAQVTATLQTTGALQNTSTAPQSISIAADQEGRAVFSVKAAQTIGTGKVVVRVKGLGETFSEEIDLTVRPSVGLVKTSVSGVVNGGQTAAVPLNVGELVPGTVKASLRVSRSPLVSLADPLNRLLQYPYGCLEQTVSVAFPQLYLAELVKTLQSGRKPYLKTGTSDLNPTTNITAALHKIETLQLFNGGFSMWQAGQREDWWTTAYAVHFMLEAQKAGYEINPATLSKALDFLNQQVSKQATEKTAQTNEDGSVTTRTRAKRETVYSLYVLSLAGKPNRAVMNYYKANPALLTSERRYLLAAAFGTVGDEGSKASLLPANFRPEQQERETGGSFSSPIRNQALVLNTLLETDPANRQIPGLARQLSAAVKQAPWLSTQEESFALLALGKLARKAAQSSVTARILSNGKVLETFSGKDLLLSKGLDQPATITATGKGSLYYFAEAEGLSRSGTIAATDQVLEVRKQYLDRNGKPLSGALQQNQLIVVKVTVRSQNGLPVDNVVVTDMLPAGLEIENPRLTPERELSWVKNQSIPDHFDLRDDRIHYFTSVSAQPKTFYYLARAVSKGRFTAGPVSADAMYNGEYRSYSGGGTVVVE
ncbi:alpha-2-macroglobulin [Siphonobacter sp. BAB-5405]|uniref:alpha-2-macroglobulin family protein n=1 Tax=Siphonobacter sp. BAB-5405 TaxID=1864825 RepID=UPI000C807B54|nr:alpha-2-macroglobulin [Siphonobacter sp. BAB-5405]PMD98475.1 alpha-2-macroglobulin [Siphonobacter sp. BAB-5405]